MKEAADVRSIDAVRDARAALIEFGEVCRAALSEASSEVQRTMWWVRSEQLTYWKNQIRRRERLLADARSEFQRAQLNAIHDQSSCIVERRMVQRAEAAIEEAHAKVRAVQYWGRALERGFMLFKGQCGNLAHAAEADMARGEAKLAGMIERLEAYVRTTSPTPGARPTGAEPAGAVPPEAPHPPDGDASDPPRDESPEIPS